MATSHQTLRDLACMRNIQIKPPVIKYQILVGGAEGLEVSAFQRDFVRHVQGKAPSSNCFHSANNFRRFSCSNSNSNTLPIRHHSRCD